MKIAAKRFLFLLLAALMLLSVACKKGDETKDTSSTAEQSAMSEDDTSVENGDVTEDGYFKKLNQGYDIDESAPTLEGDVVIIQLNNTAAFALDAGAMPSLSAFADKAAYYTDFYAQQGTEEGVYSALTSLYAPIEGMNSNAAYYGLAHLFAENGYEVYAGSMGREDTSCSKELASALGIGKGLTHIYGLPEKDASDYTEEELKSSIAKGELLPEFFGFSADNGKKDFIFIEADGIEYPYIPVSTDGVAIEGNRSLNSYICCAANLDSELGGILETIEALGDKAPTVIIYGTAPKLDGKFATYAKEYPELFEDGFSYDQAYQTPFVIYGKGITAGEINSFATVYDIYPTLAALYRFESDSMLVSGENVYMNSKLPAPSEEATLASNIAANKSYTVTLADGGAPSYMFPSFKDDGVKLTDGVNDDGKGIAENEIGIVLSGCNREHYITVDLGEVKEFDRVAIEGVAYNGTTHMGLNGKDFDLYISTNGESYKKAFGNTVVKNADTGVYQSYTKSFDFSSEARYVRFAFTGDVGYLTVTEVCVYEAIQADKEAFEPNSFRFFAPQGEYVRGTFVTDTVYYAKTDSTASAFSKAGLTEVSARTYKDHHVFVLETINECEYAVKSGFYGGDKSAEEFYADMPDSNKLVLSVEGEGGVNGSMVWHINYLSNYNVNFAANTLSGIWEGLNLKDGALTLAEGYTAGYFVTEEISLTEFDRLYVTPVAKVGDGNIRVYASYVAENGVSTPWILIDSYDKDGFVEGKGLAKVESESGYKAKSFRVKLELDCEGETAPTVSALNLTPALTPDADEEIPVFEEAVDVFVEISENGEFKDSGAAAVETLMAKALSTAPDYEKALSYIKNSDSVAGASILARYACENGLNAFVDAYTVNELMTALYKGQAIIIKDGDNYLIAAGYSEEGITVIDPLTGDKAVRAFEDISILTEVIIVDSALNTPEIIEDIIAEDSAVRPGIVVDKKKYIVIHNTGNYAPGSTAAAHATYLHGLADQPDRSVSWHYTVDSKEIYHHLPDNESAWHASDGTHGEGNKYGIGIETCVNGFPNVYQGEAYEEWLKDYTVTIKNLAYLVAKLMIENDIGMDGIKQHWDFAPDKKNCPMQMRYSSASDSFVHDGDMWVYLMSQVELQHKRLIEEGYGQ
ncbi:MAG: hypothetical protein E7597_01315 [Ruminococcaceae bacterium]|nr:hypothetical protein [Oscillospiraceae bacterium]